MVNRSMAARAAVLAREAEEAAWAASCATARESGRESREAFAVAGGPALRDAADAAWAALVAACEGDAEEARRRFDHYFTRRG